MTAQDTTVRVALIGGSGYAGFEAIRWLTRHPRAEIVGAIAPTTDIDMVFVDSRGRSEPVIADNAAADAQRAAMLRTLAKQLQRAG